MKPKLSNYIVRLIDGTQVKIRAHELYWEDTDNSLWFNKNGVMIIGFNSSQWIFWKKV